MNKVRRVFLSAVSGNILEYYDFTVYSVFSAAIGSTFFPIESAFLRIILSLAVFAVGFITRPIGGIFFGYIGDTYGRRVALIASMLGMTLSTFIIGLIPSYEDIGVYAPIILVLMRLCQGLCISGEGAGAAIFILEHHQNLRPGLTAGLVHGSNIVGTLLATFLGIIIEYFFSHIVFAWRFAFLIGGILGLMGFYLRLQVSETPIFKLLAQKKQTLNSPFTQVLKTSWRSILLTISVGATASSILYLVKTYVNVYYHDVMHYNNSTALLCLSYGVFISMLAMPLAGALADRIGRLQMIVIATFANLVLILPTLFFMASPILWHQFIALTTLGALGGIISGPAYIFIISLFAPEQKFSGVGFSYNFGIAMFGGTSPIISRWLVEKTGKLYSPALYIMLICTIFLSIIFFSRRYIMKFVNQK